MNVSTDAPLYLYQYLYSYIRLTRIHIQIRCCSFIQQKTKTHIMHHTSVMVSCVIGMLPISRVDKQVSKMQVHFCAYFHFYKSDSAIFKPRLNPKNEQLPNIIQKPLSIVQTFIQSKQTNKKILGTVRLRIIKD